MENNKSKNYILKRDESIKSDAIIAIDDGGYGHMIIMLSSDENKVRIQSEYDVLPEIEYKNTLPGLYYANMKIIPVYEEIEVDWEITTSLCQITKDINNETTH